MTQVIAPGATIGILGGGQLGRMLAMAAAQMGYRCHVFSPQPKCVAAEVSARFTQADWHDEAALAAFAADCAVLTYEFENVPVASLAAIPQDKLAPGPRALEIAQDRLAEKRFVEQLGGRPARFAAVGSRAELDAALQAIATPGILKTRREGYDGKGQHRVASPADAASIAIDGQSLIYEAQVDFPCEFSIILVRARDGGVRFWDSPHNRHEGGILRTSRLPAPQIIEHQTPEARGLAHKVADALDYTGVLTLEFFATEDGPVFNEMAPRVHNSGHWTIEGAATSQFENHIRAICGLPLGDTATLFPSIEMQNLIGEGALDPLQHFADPAARVHLYGKTGARPMRKMGHVTRVGGE